MATRPIENKVYKWVYPPEKDDPCAMIWEFEPRLHGTSLEESYNREFDTPSLDEWIVKSYTRFIKRIIVPDENDDGEQIFTDPIDILRIFKGVPENYGRTIQLAIKGEGTYLSSGELEKNSDAGQGSSLHPAKKAGANAKKKKKVGA